MFHVKRGGKMKWVLVQNIPVNYQLAVLGDEDGRPVTFNSQHEAKVFIEKNIEEDSSEVMIVPENEAI